MRDSHMVCLQERAYIEQVRRHSDCTAAQWSCGQPVCATSLCAQPAPAGWAGAAGWGCWALLRLPPHPCRVQTAPPPPLPQVSPVKYVVKKGMVPNMRVPGLL